MSRCFSLKLSLITRASLITQKIQQHRKCHSCFSLIKSDESLFLSLLEALQSKGDYFPSKLTKCRCLKGLSEMKITFEMKNKHKKSFMKHWWFITIGRLSIASKISFLTFVANSLEGFSWTYWSFFVCRKTHSPHTSSIRRKFSNSICQLDTSYRFLRNILVSPYLPHAERSKKKEAYKLRHKL